VSQSSDLRKLEQRAFQSYQQDGLLDLIIGAGILAMGLNEAMDSTIWTFVTFMLIVAYVPLKRRITIGRIGYAKFKVKRNRLNMQVVSAVVLAVLVMLLVGILFLLRGDASAPSGFLLGIRKSPLLLYALLGFMGFGLAGAISGIRRLLAYALISMGFFVSAHLLNPPIFVPFLFFGGAVLGTGSVLLLSFVRRHPIAAEETHGDQ
jgi:hypothetical protein